MLNDVLKDLTPINSIFLAMAILSICLSIFFFVRGRKVKKPYYEIKSWNIVKNFNGMFESVKILREGEPVQNVTVSKVAFWNAGREPINRDDVAPNDLLRIKLKSDFKILEVPQLQGDLNEANNIKLITSEDQSQIQFDFDYLGKGEGLVAQIVHNGLSSKDLHFEGTIKGHQIKLAKPVNNIPSIILGGIAIILMIIAGSRGLNSLAEDSLKATLRAQAQETVLAENRKALNDLKQQPDQSIENISKRMKEIQRRSEEQMRLIYPDRGKPIYTSITLWSFIIAMIFALSALSLVDSKYTSGFLIRRVPKSLKDFND